MSDSNGRRIKRALLIKGSSIKFMGEEELSKLQKIKLISDYISQTKSEIIEHNSNLDIDDF
mgnify:FL=1